MAGKRRGGKTASAPTRDLSKRNRLSKEAKEPAPIEMPAKELLEAPDEVLENYVPPSEKSDIKDDFPDVSASVAQELMKENQRSLNAGLEDIEEGDDEMEIDRAPISFSLNMEVPKSDNVERITIDLNQSKILSSDEVTVESVESEEKVDYEDSEEDSGDSVEVEEPIHIEPIAAISPHLSGVPEEVVKMSQQSKGESSFMSTPPVGKKPLQIRKENEILALKTKESVKVFDEHFIATMTLDLKDKESAKIYDAYEAYCQHREDIVKLGGEMEPREEYAIVEYIAKANTFNINWLLPMLYAFRRFQSPQQKPENRLPGKIVESLGSLEKSLKRQVEDITKQNEFLRSTCNTLHNALNKLQPNQPPKAGIVINVPEEKVYSQGVVIPGLKTNTNESKFVSIEINASDKGKEKASEKNHDKPRQEQMAVSLSGEEMNKRDLQKLLDEGQGKMRISDFVNKILMLLGLNANSLSEIPGTPNAKYNACLEVIRSHRDNVFEPYLQKQASVIKTRRMFILTAKNLVPSGSK